MISVLLIASGLLTGSLETMKGFDLGAGKDVSLSSTEKFRVMVFLSAKCPCSQSHEEKLRKLAAQYNASGFQFVAVHSNSDEDEKLARDYFTKAKLGFPVIQDGQSKIADQFKALKTPHVFVMNAKNEIVYQGGVDDSSNAEEATKEFLAETLQSLKQGKPVAVAETRALGCRIQRP